MDKKIIEFEEFQIIAKSVLKRIHDFCKKNDIKYFLAYGTLLGAVRHNDIIPWDYDIDIMMTREDLNKFIELTKKENSIDNITVYSWETHKNYYLPFVKVCDNRTQLVITKTTNPLPLGIWVDIFPIDGTPNSIEQTKELSKKIKSFVDKAKSPYIIPTNYKEKILKYLFLARSIFIKSNKYLKKANEIASKHTVKDSNTVGLTIPMDLPVEKEIFPKDYLDVLVMLPFGENSFYVPSHYNEMLTTIYGDYMKLPPEKDRAIPKLGAYWK